MNGFMPQCIDTTYRRLAVTDIAAHVRDTQHRMMRLTAGVIALFFACATACDATEIAQLTLPSAAPSNIVQNGAYFTAPIVIDGRTLFVIVTSVNAPASHEPIAERQSDVQTSLTELLAAADDGRGSGTAYDPRSLRVHVRRDANGQIESLEAVDAKHTDPLPIVTATSDDAKYNALSVASLATEWQAILQSALIHALDSRQPAVEHRGSVAVTRVGIALALATLALSFLTAYLRRRSSAVATEAAAGAREADSERERTARTPNEAHRVRRRFLALALKNVAPERRARMFSAAAEAIVWSVVLAWFVATTWALGLFPKTTPLAGALANGSLHVLITLAATALLNRILDIAIARVAKVTSKRSFASSEDRARSLLRIPTIARALAGFKTFVLAFLAVLAVLGEIGVPIGSVVTIGGLAAIALSLAAQNFVRDFVNGSLVLFEDHYVVGDYVTINTVSGIVEYLSLRMVQIRDAAGDVVTIPHSSVTTVINQSRRWSRVDYRVPVDPTADVPKAISLVKAAIETLAAEEAWAGAATLPIEWIGIDALSKDWAIVRASVRTAPLRQFEFRRELNSRVIAAFVSGNVALGAQLPAS
jgi:small conductance mechanosensitive channel